MFADLIDVDLPIHFALAARFARAAGESGLADSVLRLRAKLHAFSFDDEAEARDAVRILEGAAMASSADAAIVHAFLRTQLASGHGEPVIPIARFMKANGPRLDLVKWAAHLVYESGGPEDDPFADFHATLADLRDRVRWAAIFSAVYSNTGDDHQAAAWLERARSVELPDRDRDAIIDGAFRALGLRR